MHAVDDHGDDDDGGAEDDEDLHLCGRLCPNLSGPASPQRRMPGSGGALVIDPA